MGKVVYMPVRPNDKNKSQTYEHGGQKYTCQFDPNAPPGEQWVWVVNYVQTYQYIGSAPTLGAASIAARKKIHKLNRWEDE